MSPKAKTQDYTEHAVKECAGCGVMFRTVHDTNICGSFVCLARTTFTDSRWEAQLRMAEARIHAGVALSELDFDAFERAGKEIPW